MSARLQTRVFYGSGIGSPRVPEVTDKLLFETLEEETATQFTGLPRIRDEPGDGAISPSPVNKTQPGDLAKFATESLHSYRFSPANKKLMAESRKSFLSRSFDYMRSKFPNWERNVVSPLAAHASPVGENLAPTEPAVAVKEGAENIPDDYASPHVAPPPLRSAAPPPSGKEQKSGGLKSKKQISVRTQDLPECAPAPASPGILFSAVHSPSRYCPRLQAVLTTDNNGIIRIANEASCRVFGCEVKDIIGTDVIELLAAPFRDTCREQFRKQADGHHADNGAVIHCGKILQILKRDGSISTASLWMKGKLAATTKQQIFIWVLEEIFASQAVIEISDEGVIESTFGALEDIFGRPDTKLTGADIAEIVPAIHGASAYLSAGNRRKLNCSEFVKRRFAAGRFADGSYFPLVLRVKEETTQRTKGGDAQFRLSVTSLVTISGMVMVALDGTITAGNDSFLMHLFGYSAAELMEGRKNISILIPQFSQLIQNLRENLASAPPTPANARSPMILSSSYWRKQAILSPLPQVTPNTLEGYGAARNFGLSPIPGTPAESSGSMPQAIAQLTPLHISAVQPLQSSSTNRSAAEVLSPSGSLVTPSASSVTGIVGMHRDGFPMSIDLQIRVLKGTAGPEDPAFAVWITYDRSLLRPEANDDSVPVVAQTSVATEIRDAEGLGVGTLELKPKTPADSEKATAFGVEIKPKSIDDYHLLETIGEGAYGFAKLAVRKNDPEKRKKVIKFILKGRILIESWSKDPEIGVVPLEIRILHQLSKSPHPNIVEMKHYLQDANCFYIEMDLLGMGTDLFDYIELHRDMTEDEIKRIFLQTCLAMQHLHDRGIVHRDIKDENLIIDEKSHIRLIDFGSSAYVRSDRMFQTFCGTLDFAAPEILEGCKYSGKPQDIWAMGILLYTLVYKENPFYNIDEIIAGPLKIPFVLSPANLDLINCILNRDPNKRPTISTILEHEWLAGVKDDLDFVIPGRGDEPPQTR